MAKKSRDPFPYGTAAFDAIGCIAELDTVAGSSPWQDFERLTAYIFGQNGYAVSVGTVKTRGRQRRQYDVVAEKDGLVLLAECKQWSGSRYRLSGLKQAALKHRERARFYTDVTGREAVPVLVVLVEEEIRLFEGVPLVPVHRLDAFIAELGSGAGGCSFAEYETEDEAWPEEPGEDRDGEEEAGWP